MSTLSSSAQPVYASYEDLSPELRSCAEDIINAVRAKAPDPTIQPSLRVDREDLWQRVFNPRTSTSLSVSQTSSWNTSQPVPQHQPISPPSHSDLQLPAGYFVIDLPPSKCAVRNDSKRSKRSKHAKPLQTASSRREGQQAYIRARYDERTSDIDWFWSDGHGKGADPKFVGGMLPLPIVQSRALIQHDWTVATFADIRNREQAAHWMRCRLTRVVGQDSGQRVVDPSPADFMSLSDVRLLVPLARISPKSSAELRELLQ